MVDSEAARVFACLLARFTSHLCLPLSLSLFIYFSLSPNTLLTRKFAARHPSKCCDLLGVPRLAQLPRVEHRFLASHCMFLSLFERYQELLLTSQPTAFAPPLLHLWPRTLECIPTSPPLESRPTPLHGLPRRWGSASRKPRCARLARTQPHMSPK